LEEGGSGAGELYLNDFPQALLTDERLATLTFAASANDWTSWQYATDLAFSLGAFTTANQLQPSAAFLSDSSRDLSGQSIIAIGSSSAINASAWNANLPLQFEADGSLATLSLDGIQFLTADEQDLGILQITRQAESNAPLFCIAGNSPAGLQAAVMAAQVGLGEVLSSSANVRIIDSQQVPHDELIEKPVIATPQESTSMAWYQRWLGLNMEKANFYLLAGSTLVTVLFILWMVAGRKKK
jgi:hypothetical protein